MATEIAHPATIPNPSTVLCWECGQRVAELTEEIVITRDSRGPRKWHLACYITR